MHTRSCTSHRLDCGLVPAREFRNPTAKRSQAWHSNWHLMGGATQAHPTLPRQVIMCSSVILSRNEGRLRLKHVVNSRSTLNPTYQSCDRCTLLEGRACHRAFKRAHRCALLCAALPLRRLRLRRREKLRVRIWALCSKVDALSLARSNSWLLGGDRALNHGSPCSAQELTLGNNPPALCRMRL